MIRNRNYEKYFLKAGYIYVSKQPTLITTILGSCISLILFDKKNKYGGMNHFIYASTSDKDKSTTKFGNVALQKLLDIFLDEGSEIKNLRAQIYGGASMTQSELGKKAASLNLEICKKFLKEKKIKIIHEDTGGELSRKIIFNSKTNEVELCKLSVVYECENIGLFNSLNEGDLH